MLVLHTRELKHAMSASISVQSPPRIGIRMCAAGRFVACLDCLLSVEFPAGAHYDTIAKRFESHSCGSPGPLKDVALCGKTILGDAATSEALNRSDFDHDTTPMRVFDSSTLAFSAGDDAKRDGLGL